MSVQTKRRKEKQQMFKRNKKGQPVMKYRVHKVLSELGVA
jgi:rRNA processing